MNADERGLTEADQQYIAECLGRSPQGSFHVATRSATGRPLVIANHPLLYKNERWQPFPTLYWLIDPALSQHIAEIERKGGVKQIEQRLVDDEALLQAHRNDNMAYAQARWALLSGEEKQTAVDLGMQDTLQHSGIGGVANHAAIKCLHAQYAYHLARHDQSTTVGRIMEEHYGIRFEA